MNIVILRGTVVTDPLIQSTPQGRRVLKFRIVTSNGIDRRTGQRRLGDVHQIVYWESLYAGDTRFDLYAKHIEKDSKASVFGKIAYTRWTSKTDGQERRGTEIIARQIDVPFESSDNGEEAEAEETATESFQDAIAEHV